MAIWKRIGDKLDCFEGLSEEKKKFSKQQTISSKKLAATLLFLLDEADGNCDVVDKQIEEIEKEVFDDNSSDCVELAVRNKQISFFF
jgi:hypothetical protein